ncbi:SRPBCC family protein [Halobellus litoreus]|uniref:SRPBCC family protein n=1 Tax=Halobellus litoreus TaxID=755310 RepID=A0ABD6DYX6_9EURY|nr:SRPBCC family protein [Halobellus litoreus]
MTSVSVSRVLDEDVEVVRERMHDVETFLRAAGFDEVRRDDSRVVITNEVGPATIELTLEPFDDPDAELAYRQREGIFEEMVTTYTVTSDQASTTVVAETEFSLDVALVGSVLDSTVIKRQRRRELNAQLAYLGSGTV